MAKIGAIHRLTAEQRADLVADITAGMPWVEMEAKYGVPRPSLVDFANRQNIPRPLSKHVDNKKNTDKDNVALAVSNIFLGVAKLGTDLKPREFQEMATALGKAWEIYEKLDNETQKQVVITWEGNDV